MNQVPVSARPLEPHLAQAHPATISDAAFAMPDRYVVQSLAGTWTNVPLRPRTVRQDKGRGRCFVRERPFLDQTTKARPLADLRVSANVAPDTAVGGWIVYHGGAGVTPELLAPHIRAGHVHGAASAAGGHEHSHESATNEPEKTHESGQAAEDHHGH